MTPITLGRQQSGHAVHRYIPSFGPYRAAVTSADTPTTIAALITAGTVPIIDCNQGAREGIGQEIHVAVNGTIGDVISLYAIVNNLAFLKETKAATTVANQYFVFQDLAALQYMVAVTTLGGSTTTLYAGGSK